ncbi:MAG: P-loop NTPase fold protein, partial [Gudongella sp.]|nr:P-loop NTPase fold protein [Gudongella sp.]
MQLIGTQIIKKEKDMFSIGGNKIIKNIMEYVDDEYSSQAIQIDGKWGSGKTYYILNKVIPEIEKALKVQKDSQIVYISIYGLNSLDEISKRIFFTLYGQQSTGKIEDILGKVGKHKMGLIAGKTVVSLIAQYLNLDNLKIDFQKFIAVSRLILIVDDIERSNIEINELFGFFCLLCEHGKSKIILITNQEEMRHKDEYGKLKEKIIGVSMQYEVDFQNTYCEIVKNMYSKKYYYSVLDKNASEAFRLFSSFDHLNIRTLLFALSKFDYIVRSTIEDGIDFSDRYYHRIYSEIFNYTVFVAIVIKKEGVAPLWESDNEIDFVNTNISETNT